MEDAFKFLVVLGALCIAVNVGYFKSDEVQQGAVIETKISAKDGLTDKEKKKSVRAFQNAANDCKSKDSYNERGSSMLQISYTFNFKTGSCEEAKTLWTMQDDIFWRNPEYLSRGVVIKTYTLPTNPYF